MRDRAEDRVVMEHVLHPRPGYPFSLALSVEYALSDDGLRTRTTATNVGTRACPYGSGNHPYLASRRAQRGFADAARAGQDDPAIGRARHPDRAALPVKDTAYDFRRPRRIGATVLDHAFTDLERDQDGRARIELHDPDGGGDLTLWVDETHPYVMVFTGDPLPDVSRRSLAVEPMTCPPNAFRSGDDLIRLQPGEQFTSSWGIDPRRVSPR